MVKLLGPSGDNGGDTTALVATLSLFFLLRGIKKDC